MGLFPPLISYNYLKLFALVWFGLTSATIV